MSEHRAEQLSDSQRLPGPQSDDLLASRTPSANRPVRLITLPWVEVLYSSGYGPHCMERGGEDWKETESQLPTICSQALTKQMLYSKDRAVCLNKLTDPASSLQTSSE